MTMTTVVRNFPHCLPCCNYSWSNCCSKCYRHWRLKRSFIYGSTMTTTTTTTRSVAVETKSRRSSSSSPAAMARYYKSHWAYFVFIKSLVLGERIKPHRRRLQTYHHVPLWDRLWGLDDDDEDDDDETEASALANHHGITDRGEEAISSERFVAKLRRFFHALKAESNDKVDNVFPSWQSVSMPPFHRAANEKPIFLVGDSHVFSLAWNTIRVPAGRRRRLVVPVVVTGLKAWHVRSSTRFFTRSCLETVLPRIDAKTILFSAGEIDCREGLGGPLLQGYAEACHGHVQNTVREYVQALYELVEDDSNSVLQILVLPVAPHLFRSKGRIEAQVSRRETMRVWNDELRKLLPHRNRVFLLDYADKVQDPGHSSVYALNPVFNADSTHMNSAFVPILERAIEDSKCDRDLL